MANKMQLISVVAASVLAASFTFTGCGSSSSSTPPPVTSSSSSSLSSSSSSLSSSSSSSVPIAVQIKVSDAYVLNADVTSGAQTAIIVDNNGTYEFVQRPFDVLVSKGGANDVAAPIGEATSADPIAPDMSAPVGYTNVNPFTTMLVNGMSADDITAIYPAAGAVNATPAFNYDVVAAGDTNAQGNLDVAKDAAKAALKVSGYDGGSSSSSMSSTSSISSVSSSSSSLNCDGAFPDPGCAPAFVFQAPERSSDCDGPFPPEEGCDGSSSSVESSSSSSEASSSSESGDANQEIDNCTTNECINDVVLAEMMTLNGHYGSSSSSSEESSSSSEESSSSSEESSSSSSLNCDGAFPDEGC